MGEDEEDFDELPSITVNSSGRDSARFAMPGAAQLAEARARERECARELVRLRAEHAPRALSDSSGSEGEAGLAAAVDALRVRAGARAAPPRLAALLPAAAPLLPPSARPFLREYARVAAGAGAARADALARKTLSRMRSRLAGERDAWEEGEAAACGAWLCLALASAERARLGAGAPRAAHRLLERGAPPALAAALLAALPAARARLDLADALRCGAPAADALAARLVRAALAAELQLAPHGPRRGSEAREAAARWRRLPAPAQYAALQLAARAAAAPAPQAGGARLLAALAAAPPPGSHSPEALQVLAAVAKMRVLFPGK